jgi:peptidoglycan hydrolase CwlO-like protein
MKTTQTIAALLALGLVGCAHQKLSVVDTRPAIASIENAGTTLKKIAHAKPKEIQPLVQEAQAQVEQAKAQVEQVQKQADAVQGERDWWKNYSLSKEKEILSLESRVSHFHHLLLIISGLLAAAVAFTTWRLSVISPWIPIGLTLATYGISWLILGRL